MKTLELKLKKDVLIVDLPRLADYEFINKECKYLKIYLKIGNEEVKLNASTLDKFEFLCKGSELTEEISSELAFDGFNISENKKVYVDHYDECNCFESAIKSVISYVRIEGFHWLENPIEKPINRDEFYKSEKVDSFEILLKEWQEAEEKTFKNPLIFVKND